MSRFQPYLIATSSVADLRSYGTYRINGTIYTFVEGFFCSSRVWWVKVISLSLERTSQKSAYLVPPLALYKQPGYGSLWASRGRPPYPQSVSWSYLFCRRITESATYQAITALGDLWKAERPKEGTLPTRLTQDLTYKRIHMYTHTSIMAIYAKWQW